VTSSETTTGTATTNPAGAGIGLVAAAIAVTTWGGSGVIAKWLPMGSLAIVAYRFGVYSLIIGGVRAARGHRLGMAAFRRSLLGGLLLAADVALFFTAVKHTTIVNATIIGSLQPLLLTAYGVRFLGERVLRRDLVLGLVGLAGVIAIVLGGSSSGEASIWGDLAAAGALTAWSAYFVIAKKVSAEVSPTDFTISAAIVVTVVNAPLALLFGQSLGWPGLENFLWVLGMALASGILGHNLMNWALPRIPLWLGATFTLFVPVVSSALAWAWLDEPLSVTQIVGMAITVGALGVLVWFQQTTVIEDPGTSAAPDLI
jgi:drug/metabolite transporter (DMT)-like permease